MSVNFSDPSANNPNLPNIGTEQKAPQVFHAIGQNSDWKIVTTNDDWQWVTGVTMTAVRPNSTYHVTVSTYAVANGSANDGKGIPYIRIQRGNTNTYVASNSNGLEGRTFSGDYGNPSRTIHDGSLFCFTVKDYPELRTGDTVTYSLQAKCNKTGNNGFFSARFGYGDEGFGFDGASLVVKEIGRGLTDANAIGR